MVATSLPMFQKNKVDDEEKVQSTGKVIWTLWHKDHSLFLDILNNCWLSDMHFSLCNSLNVACTDCNNGASSLKVKINIVVFYFGHD